jgi:hypothetical protein
VKGGSGTSVVASLLSVACAALDTTILIDVDGDQPAIFGIEAASTGVHDWWRAGDIGNEALMRLSLPVGGGLSLIPAGATHADHVAHSRPHPNVEAARNVDIPDSGMIVVDAGTIRHPGGVSTAFVASARTSLLVLRPCYLAARRAAMSNARIDGLVLIDEPGRVLRGDDLSEVVGAPVVATLPWDPSIARVVDAGRLGRRVPRAAKPLESLAKSLFLSEAQHVR